MGSSLSTQPPSPTHAVQVVKQEAKHYVETCASSACGNGSVGGSGSDGGSRDSAVERTTVAGLAPKVEIMGSIPSEDGGGGGGGGGGDGAVGVGVGGGDGGSSSGGGGGVLGEEMGSGEGGAGSGVTANGGGGSPGTGDDNRKRKRQGGGGEEGEGVAIRGGGEVGGRGREEGEEEEEGALMRAITSLGLDGRFSIVHANAALCDRTRRFRLSSCSSPPPSLARSSLPPSPPSPSPPSTAAATAASTKEEDGVGVGDGDGGGGAAKKETLRFDDLGLTVHAWAVGEKRTRKRTRFVDGDRTDGGSGGSGDGGGGDGGGGGVPGAAGAGGSRARGGSALASSALARGQEEMQRDLFREVAQVRVVLGRAGGLADCRSATTVVGWLGILDQATNSYGLVGTT